MNVREAADYARPDIENFEVCSKMNVFVKDGFYNTESAVEQPHTCIRAYLSCEQRDVDAPECFDASRPHLLATGLRVEYPGT